MKVQVVVKQGERRWDSIRSSVDAALHQIGVYMAKDNDEIVRSIGNILTQHLIAFGSSNAAIEHLVYMGFEVETKRILNPTI